MSKFENKMMNNIDCSWKTGNDQHFDIKTLF